ncbi:MAG: glutamate-cysteine ligase family protein, partial [Actinomycetota bacterium]|nr:glutamate-cysteine ligase family protein [Actinomycetota bacterium]
MPAAAATSCPPLTVADVVEHVAGVCFKTGPPGLVGVESEWLVVDASAPHLPVPLARLQAAVEPLAPLPGGCSITYEPGGQLELSSPPSLGPAGCISALQSDLTAIAPGLAAAGLSLYGLGLDPLRSPRRQLEAPRYAAMEAYFDARGPAGRRMMCSTAAIQVCVDVGADAADAARRWALAHALGPVLVAAFANSPFSGGRPSGWRSGRQAVWLALDPAERRRDSGADPARTWAAEVLAAPVMLWRRPTGPWLPDPGCTFGEWVGSGSVTRADLDYHLSTLFPPVRPRGWYELRYLDAQFPAHWPVAVAVVAALLDDPRA